MPDSASFPCLACGASLAFEPGTTRLSCGYCGGETPIPRSEDEVVELDFAAALRDPKSAERIENFECFECPGCGAQLEQTSDLTASACCYCDTPFVDERRHAQRVKPGALLPFKIDREQARKAYEHWLSKLWFAPRELALRAQRIEGLQGVYLPYWSYQSHTTTYYTGLRGEDYFVDKTVRVQDKGRWVTKTERVRKTRWYPTAGVVGKRFEDLLILASKGLPRNQAAALEPWDLGALVPYQRGFLFGFRSERYQLGLEEGFECAKELMRPAIGRAIARDIGGDRQRVLTQRTSYRDITFKHLLLPLWITAFRYRERVYRVLVNARTGAVKGERPWSWVKIGAACALLIAVLALVIWLRETGRI